VIVEEPTRRRRRRRRRSRSRQQSAQSLMQSIVVGIIILFVIAVAFAFATRGPANGSGAPASEVDKYGRSTKPEGTPDNSGNGIIRQSEN
jgi:cell division protein FtsN